MKVKVKKAQVIDNTVGVTVIETPNIIDKLVMELRDVEGWEFKQIVKLARAYRRADKHLERAIANETTT